MDAHLYKMMPKVKGKPGRLSAGCYAVVGITLLTVVLLVVSSEVDKTRDRHQELLLLRKIWINQQRIGHGAGCPGSNAGTPQNGAEQASAAAAEGSVHVQSAAVQPTALKLGAKGAKGIAGSTGRKYHTIMAVGDGMYSRWQTRIHYYWYLRRKAECEQLLGDACEIGGFTRVLQSGKQDDLVEEVPTFIAKAYPEEHDYPPLERPYAIQQWVEQADIPEQYVFLADPDHIFLRPLPNLMGSDMRPVGFRFWYMRPAKAKLIPVIAKFLPSKQLTAEEAKRIPATGPSPFMMTLEQMRKVVPLWNDLTTEIHKDEEAREAFGWIQEMYSFCMALYVAGLDVDLNTYLLAHPPEDEELEHSSGKPYYIAHFTYNSGVLVDSVRDIHTVDKEDVPRAIWLFDKRQYMDEAPPRNLQPPPPRAKHDMVRKLIAAINTATENIPCWDDYVKTGHVPTTCDEIIPGTVYPTVPPSRGRGVKQRPSA